jgi:hypothetical protein
LRSAIIRFIHQSSELGFACWASTFTAPYSGSLITGRYSCCGLAREKPAFRSALHCIGVRTPFRSPR